MADHVTGFAAVRVEVAARGVECRAAEAALALLRVAQGAPQPAASEAA